MRLVCTILQSSIGKKLLVALAGLLLCGFLLVHLAGNLFLFAGASTFNNYAEHLANNPFLPAAEILLAVLFLLHILVSLTARYQNRQARPIGYEAAHAKGGRTWGSRTMSYTALLVLAFLIIHLKSFRFADDKGDLYTLVMTAFKNKYYSLFYVVAMGALGLHLSHGFQSAFQTLGINHPRYTPLLKKFGLAFAVIISIGFAILPLWAYMRQP